MSPRNALRLSLLTALVVPGIGCGSMPRMFHHGAADPSVRFPRSARLAAFVGAEPSATATTSAPSGPSTRPAVTSQAGTTQPATTQSGRRTGYSAPGAGVRQFDFLAVVAALGSVPATTGGGRERSETLAAPLPSTIRGRPGLTAPQTTAMVTINGRPGLVEGTATGLSFASRFNTIFSARLNPLSGATGRCRDLARANFFNGSTAACEQHFSRH